MEWIIDPSHTSVEFAVRHMAISTVRGRFKKVSGTLEAADDGILKSIEATIEAASIDTAEPQRDAHLRSPDFLDADNQPYLQFRSSAVEALGAGRYRVTKTGASPGIRCSSLERYWSGKRCDSHLTFRR